jgi:type II secretory pathway pseudopilin PulG
VFNLNKKYKGIFTAELIVSLTVMGMLLVGLSLSLYGIAKFNRFQLVKQQCVAAAQAQLDSISVTGQPVSDDEFKKLWPKINAAIEQSDGTGQWEGLKLVRAKTSGMSFDSRVNVELSRYIRIPIHGQEL